MIKKPAFLTLAFLLTGSVTFTSQASYLKDWLWFDVDRQAKTNSSQLLSRSPGILFTSQFENWLSQEDRWFTSQSSSFYALQHFESANHQVQMGLALQASKEATEFENALNQQRLEADTRQQSFGGGLQLKNHILGVALIDTDYQKESIFSWFPLPDLELFMLSKQATNTWQMNAQAAKVDNEDLFSAPQVETYQLQMELVFDDSMRGSGIHWQSRWGEIFYQHVESERAYHIDSLYQLNLNTNWSIGYQHNSQSDRSTARLEINGESRSLLGFNNYVNYQSNSNMQTLKLDYSLSKTRISLFIRRGSLTSSIESLFDANSMSGYWSSLIVGSGVGNGDLDVALQSAGLGYQLNKNKGWQTDVLLDYVQLQLDAGSDYRINAFPFGVLERNEETLSITGADLLMLKLGLGYRFSDWLVRYQFFQVIPLDIKSNGNNNNSGNEATGKNGFKLDGVPDGNIQTLSVQYYF